MTALFLCLALSLPLTACGDRPPNVQVVDLPDVPTITEPRQLTSGRSGTITEVAPPAVLIDLEELIADQRPSLRITYPKAEQVIDDTGFGSELQLRGLSIYKEESTGLGPHIQIAIDNQPARSVYSLDEPIAFTDLAPGTHTLRAIAVKPWGESYKNDEAFAETTFHLFAPTQSNAPDREQPELIYSQPQGTYTAEPILLDFQLNNAPLHLLAADDDSLTNWQIRCTINGQSFTFDQWNPIYLRGFNPGQNWIQLTLVDEEGNPIENAFNSTVRLINYDPKQLDSLGQLMRGELPLREVGTIVDPGYIPPALPEPVRTQPEQPENAKIEDAELEVEQPEAASSTEQSIVQPTEEPIEEPAVEEFAVEELEVEDPAEEQTQPDPYIEENVAEDAEEMIEVDAEIEPAQSDREVAPDSSDITTTAEDTQASPSDSAAVEPASRPSFFSRIQDVFKLDRFKDAADPTDEQAASEIEETAEPIEELETSSDSSSENGELMDRDLESEDLESRDLEDADPEDANLKTDRAVELNADVPNSVETDEDNGIDAKESMVDESAEAELDAVSSQESSVPSEDPTSAAFGSAVFDLKESAPAALESILERPAPETPVPERPVPERPVPEMPIPERLVPETSELDKPTLEERSTAEDRAVEANKRPSFFEKIKSALKQPNGLQTTPVENEGDRPASERLSPSGLDSTDDTEIDSIEIDVTTDTALNEESSRPIDSVQNPLERSLNRYEDRDYDTVEGNSENLDLENLDLDEDLDLDKLDLENFDADDVDSDKTETSSEESIGEE